MGLAGEGVAGIEPRAIPADAPLVPEGHQEGLPEGDAAILDRVVGVDVEIAGAGELQVADRVLGEGAEHVVEKPDPGLDPGPAPAVDIEVHPDGGLAGLPLDLGAPLGHVREAVTVAGAGNKVFV